MFKKKVLKRKQLLRAKTEMFANKESWSHQTKNREGSLSWTPKLSPSQWSSDFRQYLTELLVEVVEISIILDHNISLASLQIQRHLSHHSVSGIFLAQSISLHQSLELSFLTDPHDNNGFRPFIHLHFEQQRDIDNDQFSSFRPLFQNLPKDTSWYVWSHQPIKRERDKFRISSLERELSNPLLTCLEVGAWNLKRRPSDRVLAGPLLY